MIQPALLVSSASPALALATTAGANPAAFARSLAALVEAAMPSGQQLAAPGKTLPTAIEPALPGEAAATDGPTAPLAAILPQPVGQASGMPTLQEAVAMVPAEAIAFPSIPPATQPATPAASLAPVTELLLAVPASAPQPKPRPVVAGAAKRMAAPLPALPTPVVAMASAPTAPRDVMPGEDVAETLVPDGSDAPAPARPATSPMPPLVAASAQEIPAAAPTVSAEAPLLAPPVSSGDVHAPAPPLVAPGDPADLPASGGTPSPRAVSAQDAAAAAQTIAEAPPPVPVLGRDARPQVSRSPVLDDRSDVLAALPAEKGDTPALCTEDIPADTPIPAQATLPASVPAAPVVQDVPPAPAAAPTRSAVARPQTEVAVARPVSRGSASTGRSAPVVVNGLGGTRYEGPAEEPPVEEGAAPTDPAKAAGAPPPPGDPSIDSGQALPPLAAPAPDASVAPEATTFPVSAAMAGPAASAEDREPLAAPSPVARPPVAVPPLRTNPDSPSQPRDDRWTTASVSISARAPVPMPVLAGVAIASPSAVQPAPPVDTVAADPSKPLAPPVFGIAAAPAEPAPAEPAPAQALSAPSAVTPAPLIQPPRAGEPTISAPAAEVAASDGADVRRADSRTAATPWRMPLSDALPRATGTAAPAFRVFAAALHAARSDEADRPALAASSGAAPVELPRAPLVRATGEGVPLDMTDRRWPHAMVERIETLRDAASAARDAASTSIRLMPDALGTIDVSVRAQGDTVHVHFAADQAQTRTLLAEAQPRLAELAESRGIKLAQANVGSGSEGNAPRQPMPQPAPAAAPPSALRDEEPETPTTRVA